MHVPENTEWFIAEQVQQFKVGDESSSLVWLNSILVRASSQEEAFARAIQLSEPLNHEYTNGDGVKVRSIFLGLSDLNPVHEKLDDGAELWFSAREDQTQEQVNALVRTKEELFEHTEQKVEELD